jgi:two-component system C4-dicarboxylate transport response regulator DctD
LDDEPLLADAMAETLAARGKEVRRFSDAREALAELSRDPPQLLITDLVMPGLDGEELIACARRRQPDLRILVISGYPLAAEFARSHNIRFLRKPFSGDGLNAVVDRALAEAGQPVPGVKE